MSDTLNPEWTDDEHPGHFTERDEKCVFDLGTCACDICLCEYSYLYMYIFVCLYVFASLTYRLIIQRTWQLIIIDLDSVKARQNELIDEYRRLGKRRVKELTNDLAIFRLEVYDYNRWSKPFHMGTVRCGVQTVGNAIRSLYRPIFERKSRMSSRRNRHKKSRIGFDDDYDGDSNVHVDGVSVSECNQILNVQGDEEHEDEGVDDEEEGDDEEYDEGYDEEYDDGDYEDNAELFEDAFYGEEGGVQDFAEDESKGDEGEEQVDQEGEGDEEAEAEDDSENEDSESAASSSSHDVPVVKSAPSLLRRFTTFIGLTPMEEKELPKGTL